jgi:hypothetical protein
MDSINLEINLNNTHVLSFVVDRFVDGEESNFYDSIKFHYELYLTNFGWFKINEEPTLNGDGNTETLEIRAESLEIELQQYDLQGFRVNCGSEDSWEMMAKDNQYRADLQDGTKTDFYLPRSQVLFYKDTAKMEEVIKTVSKNITEESLRDVFMQAPNFLWSWRVKPSTANFDTGTAFDQILALINQGEGTQYGRRGAVSEFRTAYNQLPNLYPTDEELLLEKKRELIKQYLTIWFPDYIDHILYTYDFKEEIQNYDVNSNTYSYTYRKITPYELLEYAVAQINETSFLWLVLKDTGWKVGYVDDTVYQAGNNLNPSYQLTYNNYADVVVNSDLYGNLSLNLTHDGVKNVTVTDTQLTNDYMYDNDSGSVYMRSEDLEYVGYLKDQVGKFEVENQDVYSFLT